MFFLNKTPLLFPTQLHSGFQGDAFLEELWQGMIRAGWPGKLVTESDEVDAAPKDFVVMDPEAVPWIFWLFGLGYLCYLCYWFGLLMYLGFFGCLVFWVMFYCKLYLGSTES